MSEAAHNLDLTLANMRAKEQKPYLPAEKVLHLLISMGSYNFNATREEKDAAIVRAQEALYKDGLRYHG